MSDGDALLRTILNNPDDDTARLVYADWLQENGNEDRAEFIRLQCEYQTWRPSALCVHNSKPHYRFKPSKRCGLSTDNPAHNCPCRSELLRVRERDLWADQVRGAHDAGGLLWGLSVERVTVPSKSAPRTYAEETYVVERGFVAHVFVPLAAFMQHAPALFRAHPIERVTLTDRTALGDDELGGGRGLYRSWNCDNTRMQVMWPNFLYYLPAPIFDRLKGGELVQDSQGTEGFRRYPVYQAPAYSDLSQACVAYGRECAGLSALPRSESK